MRQCPVCFGEATGIIGRAAQRRHRNYAASGASLKPRRSRCVTASDVVNPDAVDAAFFEELRKQYSDDEIVELGTFIGFNIGYHTFFGTLKLYPLSSPDGRLVSQEESEKLYGAAPASLKKSEAADQSHRAAPLDESPIPIACADR